ncbi:hypothetical protein D6C90_03434 [Aureobasidium pullulans]|uniref:Uncharacterized protein n=1 Tax=Aureobasidium pullulans TaxID=5580 RepID=A0A4S9DQF0_AURPU|nr:hypothetical protein D6D12_09791 [Aureobasidium pullulans]THX63822.1 hypothetical protein D6D11_01559 [Aureobasidium pullulans]THZ49494.1 hypothetical protein D6C90_03434 [Aureobasidium pullulans]
MSVVTRHWKQSSDKSEPEPLVQEDTDDKTDDDSFPQPREFDAPIRGYNLWFGTGQFKAPKAGRRAGSYLDLRYFVPVLAIVCTIAVIPLTIPRATRKAPAWNHQDGIEVYDCGSASVTARGTMIGDLAINIVAFDKLSFTAAKVIDLAWNVRAGRLSQFLAAYLCYRVSTGVLYLTAEQQRVPAEAFAALSLNPTSIWSCLPVFESLSLAKMRLFNRLALVWVIISMIYLLCIVTMVDLMTGYQTGQATWFKQPDGKMVNADVGPEAIVKDLSITITAPPQNITMPGGNVATLHWTGDTGDIQVPQAQMPIDPNTNESTIFYQTCVDHEKMGIYYLNVTYTTPDHWSPFTSFDNGTRHSTMPDLSTSYEDESCKNLFPLLNVDYYGLYYLINFGWWETPVNFLCVPADYYRWGFSQRYTILLTSINSVWLLITAALWLYVELYSQLLQKRGRLDKWRAVLDMASALQQRFGHDTGAYTEDELEKEVEKLTPLCYSTVAHEGSNEERIVLEECEKGENWRKGRLRLRWKVKYW